MVIPDGDANQAVAPVLFRTTIPSLQLKKGEPFDPGEVNERSIDHQTQLGGSPQPDALKALKFLHTIGEGYHPSSRIVKSKTASSLGRISKLLRRCQPKTCIGPCLATAYENLGDPKRALKHLQRIYGRKRYSLGRTAISATIATSGGMMHGALPK